MIKFLLKSYIAMMLTLCIAGGFIGGAQAIKQTLNENI